MLGIIGPHLLIHSAYAQICDLSIFLYFRNKFSLGQFLWPNMRATNTWLPYEFEHKSVKWVRLLLLLLITIISNYHWILVFIHSFLKRIKPQNAQDYKKGTWRKQNTIAKGKHSHPLMEAYLCHLHPILSVTTQSSRGSRVGLMDHMVPRPPPVLIFLFLVVFFFLCQLWFQTLVHRESLRRNYILLFQACVHILFIIFETSLVSSGFLFQHPDTVI